MSASTKMGGVGSGAVVVLAAGGRDSRNVAGRNANWRNKRSWCGPKSWQTPSPLTMAWSIGGSTRVSGH